MIIKTIAWIYDLLLDVSIVVITIVKKAGLDSVLMVTHLLNDRMRPMPLFILSQMGIFNFSLNRLWNEGLEMFTVSPWSGGNCDLRTALSAQVVWCHSL